MNYALVLYTCMVLNDQRELQPSLHITSSYRQTLNSHNQQSLLLRLDLSYNLQKNDNNHYYGKL